MIRKIRERLESSSTLLKPSLRKVGRIEFVPDDANTEASAIGTGWMIEPTTVVTNAHVAERFVKSAGDGSLIVKIEGVGAVACDFAREHQVDQVLPTRITGVRWMPPSGSPIDAALLNVEARDCELPEPLELDSEPGESDQDIATIGYPMKDAHNDYFKVLKYFRRIYGVKRLSPGKVTESSDTLVMHHGLHDAWRFVGFSANLARSGKVIGLHFSGQFSSRNSAIKISHIKKQLAKD